MINIDVYFDLETVPPELNDKELSDFKSNLSPPGNIKKEETRLRWIEENWEEKYRKMSLDTSLARIITFGYNFNKKEDGTEVLVSDGLKDSDQQDIIEAFYNELKKEALNISKSEGIELTEDDLEDDAFMSYLNITWIGMNVKKFDLDLIWKRCIRYKMKSLAKLIPRERFSRNVIDLQDIFLGGQQGYISQKAICDAIGIEGKPGEIDGSQVYDYYLAGKINEIAEYNKYDVDKIIEIRERFFI